MRCRFHDRAEAGRLLAERLQGYGHRPDVLVLGLPRGGMPVAFEVAQALAAPLDVFLVRKLGVPGQEELAMGAIASGGVRFINEDVVEAMGITQATIDEVAEDEQRELLRRQQLYRDDRPLPRITGHNVILIDDGLATGSTMRAAATAVRLQNPAHLIVAVPVAARSTCFELHQLADEMVCLQTPEPFHAVGLWYEDFSQTTDQQVRDLLQRAAQHPAEV